MLHAFFKKKYREGTSGCDLLNKAGTVLYLLKLRSPLKKCGEKCGESAALWLIVNTVSRKCDCCAKCGVRDTLTQCESQKYDAAPHFRDTFFGRFLADFGAAFSGHTIFNDAEYENDIPEEILRNLACLSAESKPSH